MGSGPPSRQDKYQSAPVSRSRAGGPASGGRGQCPDRRAPRERLGHHPQSCGHLTPLPQVEGSQLVEQHRGSLLGVGHGSSLLSMRGPTTPRASMSNADADRSRAMCGCPHPLMHPAGSVARPTQTYSNWKPHTGPLAFQHSREHRQGQWSRHEPGGPQREPHVRSARDHRGATTVGGPQGVGDDALGGHPGKCR